MAAALAPAGVLALAAVAADGDAALVAAGMLAASAAAMVEPASVVVRSEGGLDDVDDEDEEWNPAFILAAAAAAIPYMSSLAFVGLALDEETAANVRGARIAAGSVYAIPVIFAPEEARNGIAALAAVLASVHVQLERVAAKRREASPGDPSALLARLGRGAATATSALAADAPGAVRTLATGAAAEERRQAAAVEAELQAADDEEEAAFARRELEDFDERLGKRD